MSLKVDAFIIFLNMLRMDALSALYWYHLFLLGTVKE